MDRNALTALALRPHNLECGQLFDADPGPLVESSVPIDIASGRGRHRWRGRVEGSDVIGTISDTVVALVVTKGIVTQG